MKRINKKASERKSEIIKAARDHFRTKDFRKITMQGLIDTIGIAKGTLYHHFSSKNEILEAVVEQMVDEQVEKIKELLNNNTSLPALEKFRLLIVESNMEEDNEQLLANLHHPDNYEIHGRHLARTIEEMAPLYASVITDGCKEKVFNTKHPLECAEFILGGVQFITDVGFYNWSNEQLSRRASALPALIEAQLGAPEKSFDFLTS
ncbi:MAG: TetR/AcrR family transcriptional regulator [Bdellovibrionaceae bacterium]|nr:TetR/AcrR family transcriptional regulator [Pseudobdellovibrionaceae bacterium]